MTAWLDDLRARLQLAPPGSSTLLLGIVEGDASLEPTRRLLMDLLRATPLTVVDLGAVAPDAGPGRWAELMRTSTADVHVLTVAPSSPLSLRPMVTLFNAERELLRQLGGPLLLLASRGTEKAIRQHSPDFFTWVARSYELPAQADLAALANLAGASPAPADVPAPEDPIRFLHVSDLHLRIAKRYDQDRVLRGLVDFLERDRAGFPLDLVFVTGDLANTGSADEYALVVELLEKLMEVTGVSSERVFVVPGNHDVDRDVGRWLLRTLGRDEESVAFFEDARSRVFHLEKLKAYGESMRALLGEKRALGLTVGEDAVELVSVRGAHLAVASFNSAWFAQGDDDHGKLWLGEPSVDRAGQRVAAEKVPFAVALLHHPFDDLAEIERDSVQSYLERSFDVVMRGHLHKDKTRAIATQRGGYVEVAAPAAYQGSQWPNGCFLGEIRTKAHTVRLRPLTYASGADGWVLDTKVFPDDGKDGYCHIFTVPEKRRHSGTAAMRLERAAEEAVRAASPEQQRKIAERLDLVAPGARMSPGLVQRTAKLARTHAGEPEFLGEVLTPEKFGRTLGGAVALDLTKQDLISREDPEFLEKSLRRVIPYVYHMQREVRRGVAVLWETETELTWALHSALGAVLDRPSAVVNPLLPGGLRPDILIGSLGEPSAQIAIIEIKRSRRGPTTLSNGLAQLDRYLVSAGTVHGALVLFNALSSTETEPQIEHATTPAGRDVLLVRI